MTAELRRRPAFAAVLLCALVLIASLAIPAIGRIARSSQAGTAKKVAAALTLAKAAGIESKRALTFAGKLVVAGTAGPDGAAGAKGQTGDPGATGAAGDTGDDGDAGGTGTSGIAGADGSTGGNGSAGGTGGTGTAGGAGGTGTSGIAGADGGNGTNGSNTMTPATVATFTGSQPSSVTAITMTNATWDQLATEVDLLTGTATVTTPATCGGGLGVTISVDGTPTFGGFTATADGSPVTFSMTSVNPLLSNFNSTTPILFEPGSLTGHTITAAIGDSCGGSSDYTLTSLRINVGRIR